MIQTVIQPSDPRNQPPFIVVVILAWPGWRRAGYDPMILWSLCRQTGRAVAV